MSKNNDNGFIDRLEIMFGKNAAALARKANVKQQTASSWLTGTKPSFQALAAVAMAAEVNMNWLATGQGPIFIGDNADNSKLDMKSQYAEIAMKHVLELSEKHNLTIPAQNVWFAVHLFNEIMLDVYKGENIPDDKIEQSLKRYIEMPMRQSGLLK